MRYDTLINILDEIRKEAKGKHDKKYHVGSTNEDEINQARSRAYIHLYLKVAFGIIDFEEREHFITDGTQDGGIDGYFINTENKTVYLIQSKFRVTENNFEKKDMSYDDILSMQISRISNGEEYDENGVEYSGKIKQLQRELSQVPDIAKYSYKVIVMANINSISETNLKKLFEGFPFEILNFEKCYEQLIFPVITGTYFNAADLVINIDLSNKNAGSKISYTVTTKISDCDITVLFIPALELAKIMHKYKNSILKYNPRSYIELEGKNIHQAIRDTILNEATNEFALFNNGITMLSDETYINERIGQKNKAQLIVKNPQIVNGGQTCFTLSRIYEELGAEDAENKFSGKEVLLKVITLREYSNENDKLEFIAELSNATNRQTPVINADKYSNELTHIKLQKLVFENFGLLYERKRGEFADGIFNKYIDENIVIERNLFWRIYYSSNGDFPKGTQKRLFQKNEIPDDILTNKSALENFNIGLKVFRKIDDLRKPFIKRPHSSYAKVYVYSQYICTEQNWEKILNEMETELSNLWYKFNSEMYKIGKLVIKEKMNKITGEIKKITKREEYDYTTIKEDLKIFMENNKL